MPSCRILLLCTCSTLLSTVQAAPIYPLDPQKYGMHKPFAPPKPITPLTVLTATPENQFADTAHAQSFNVVNRVNERVDKPFHLTIGQYDGSTYTGALWRQREANYYVIGSLNYTNAQDYEDGRGITIDAGHDRIGGAFVLGYLPTINMEHRFTFVYDDINDDKQPQHPIDPVNTRRLIGKYDGRFGAQDDSNTLHVGLSAVDLERSANNFDLRNTPNPRAPKIFVDIERNKYAIDLHYNFTVDAQNQSSVGMSFVDDRHDAKRFVKTPRGDNQNGYRFPDVDVQTMSLYASHQWTPTLEHSVKGAINYDWQVADVQQANKRFMVGKTPMGQPITLSSADLWQKYYNRKLTNDIEQDGLSAQLRYTYTPSVNQQFYAEIASLYRMPENPERFAVLPGPQGNAWAANPWIKPERENRLTLGVSLNGEGWGDYQQTKQDDYASAWQIRGEMYYSDVDDFITIDRYRGPKTPLTYNIITRNVDAKLAGIDIHYSQNWSPNFSTSLNLNYEYGKNKTDNRPLYQISPFSTSLNVDWQDYFASGSYSIGSRIRYQHEQSHRDDNPLTGTGIDNASDGYTIVDLYSGIEWKNDIGLSFGVDNLFDRDYAKFITDDHVQAVNPTVINGPGRTYWLRLNAAF